MEELKRLDDLVQTSGVMPSLCVGESGCLIFALGLCLAMEVIGNAIWLGILLGFVGAVWMLLAYPVHQKASRKQSRSMLPESWN